MTLDPVAVAWLAAAISLIAWLRPRKRIQVDD